MPVAMHQNPQVVRYFVGFARVTGITLVLVALGAIVGLLYEIPLLAAVFPSQHVMRGSTAVGFILVGLALSTSLHQYRHAQRISICLSFTVLALATTNILQYVLSIELGLDNWFAHPFLEGHKPLSGRMPQETAVAFIMLGVMGILTSLRRWLWLREMCGVLVLAIAMIALGVYGFSLAGPIETLFSSVAFNAAVLLLMATLGWMASTPSVGLTRIATADSIGGAFARRLLLPSLLLPIAYTFTLRSMQIMLGLSESLAVSLASMFTGGTVAYLVWKVANLLDKTERHRRESHVLRDNANTDVLTNIANRRAFDEALTQMLRGRREQDEVFSLLLLDLDKFKDYNDAFGHLAGDDVLRNTGHLLRAALRPSDLPARYGGEEFALLLAGTDAAHARRVAERIITDFHARTWPHKPVTASIGIAEARCADTADDLIRRADAALYQAKREGRNRAV